MNWPNPRRSASIAKIEYRRSIRAMLKNPVQLLGFAFFLLVFVGGPTLGGSYVAYRFGGQIDQLPDSLPLLDFARGGLAVAWLSITALVVARAVGKTGRIDHEAGILTTVPARDAVGGLVLAEFARIGSVVALPLLSISAAWSVALGTPTVFITIVLAMLGLFTTAILAGHIVGLLLKVAFARSELLTQYKSVIAVAGFAVYMAAILSNALGRVMTTLGGLLQDVPTAWLGDVFMLGIPGISVSLSRVGGAVAFVAVTIPVLVSLDVRTATWLWYGDQVQVENKKYDSDESSADFLSGFVSRPTRTVTANVWRRTKRAPLRLLYVVYPVFFMTAPLQNAVQTGVISDFLAISIALYGAWAIGATALNPLGDEGAMLPVTITSTIRGEQFVRGHVLAVTLVGLPFVVVATAVAGVLSPLEHWVGLTVGSALLSVAGTVVALAIGTVFPRFSSVRVTRSRRVVVPSKSAFALYTILLLAGFAGTAVAAVPAGAAMVSNVISFWSSLLWQPILLPPSTIRIVGGAVAVFLGVVAPPLAYRYTVRKFDRYVLG
ncbi:hypothetical protein SAMN05421858_2677 [Haladaptatus litoreus]|uniref:ABC-2 type transport system permease protein n=1 Tax=Haladaptatus litoreus TaxID=553468 RepID=A0A1N7BPU3_9EURY|nr:hypothetical protein [Haladaptatus litoreus]SIR53233.1 hypothetical protein SAMN05421858_2677 [Haladaptatus litoreus]